jgi:hypothetical protein
MTSSNSMEHSPSYEADACRQSKNSPHFTEFEGSSTLTLTLTKTLEV